MKHEVIIKRDDGTRVKLDMRVYLDNYQEGKPNYEVVVRTCGKGKRTWKDVVDEDNYQFRSLSMKDRRKWVAEKQLTVVSAEEINQAKFDLWQKLKP